MRVLLFMVLILSVIELSGQVIYFVFKDRWLLLNTSVSKPTVILNEHASVMWRPSSVKPHHNGALPIDARGFVKTASVPTSATRKLVLVGGSTVRG